MTMRRLALALACTFACAGAQAEDALASFGWLSGCWQPADAKAEAGSGEQWMTPAGGTLLGMSRTVRGGKTVAHEFLQIREVTPGKVVFIAAPSGQPQATFVLVGQAADGFVFENPKHDFPQRISYRRDGERGLLARIEGKLKGKRKSIEFPMRRVPCELPN